MCGSGRFRVAFDELVEPRQCVLAKARDHVGVDGPGLFLTIEPVERHRLVPERERYLNAQLGLRNLLEAVDQRVEDHNLWS
jgi:hypothetical protein